MSITQYNSSVRQMSQSKFNSMKNASGKIPDLANQIVMTNSEDSNISCLRTEVVYDMTSSDASKNWGYPNGIQGGITISGKNFIKYERLRVYAHTDWYKQSFEISTEVSSIYGKMNTQSPDSNNHNSTYIKMNTTNDGFNISFYSVLIPSGSSTWTLMNGNSNYYIYKIEGVLKTPSMIYTGDELIAGNGISIANGVISSSSNSTLLNATKYNITTDTRVPISKATLQQYSYILIEVDCYDSGGVNRISRATGYFKVSDLVEYEIVDDYNSMSFYSRKYALLGTINFAVNTNNMVFSCEFASPYGQTNLNAVANDQIYIGNIWGIK